MFIMVDLVTKNSFLLLFVYIVNSIVLFAVYNFFIRFKFKSALNGCFYISV